MISVSNTTRGRKRAKRLQKSRNVAEPNGRRHNPTLIHFLDRDVMGYAGLYQVSNLGRIRSIGRECDSKNGSKQKWRDA